MMIKKERKTSVMESFLNSMCKTRLKCQRFRSVTMRLPSSKPCQKHRSLRGQGDRPC